MLALLLVPVVSEKFLALVYELKIFVRALLCVADGAGVEHLTVCCKILPKKLKSVISQLSKLSQLTINGQTDSSKNTNFNNFSFF